MNTRMADTSRPDAWLESGRYWRTDTVEPYQRVSTLLNNMPKEALAKWKLKLAAEAAVTEQEVWGEMPARSAVEYLKTAADRVAQEAADKGTAAHNSIHHLLMTGEHDGNDYVDAAVNFMAGNLQDPEGCEFFLPEVMVFSESSPRYAGTADLLTQVKDGMRVLVDWKTGSIGWASQALQLWLYAHADQMFIADADLPGFQAMPHIHWGVVVGVRPAGVYEAQWINFADPRVHALMAAAVLGLASIADIESQTIFQGGRSQ